MDALNFGWSVLSCMDDDRNCWTVHLKTRAEIYKTNSASDQFCRLQNPRFRFKTLRFQFLSYCVLSLLCLENHFWRKSMVNAFSSNENCIWSVLIFSRRRKRHVEDQLTKMCQKRLKTYFLKISAQIQNWCLDEPLSCFQNSATKKRILEAPHKASPSQGSMTRGDVTIHKKRKKLNDRNSPKKRRPTEVLWTGVGLAFGPQKTVDPTGNSATSMPKIEKGQTHQTLEDRSAAVFRID